VTFRLLYTISLRSKHNFTNNRCTPHKKIKWQTLYQTHNIDFSTDRTVEKRSVVNSSHIPCLIFLQTVYFTGENLSPVHTLLKISQGHSTHMTSEAELATVLIQGVSIYTSCANAIHQHWSLLPPHALYQYIYAALTYLSPHFPMFLSLCNDDLSSAQVM
jgi:hypothetical protein